MFNATKSPSTSQSKSLSLYLEPERNSFNLVRLIAALTVLVSHAIIVRVGVDTLDPLQGPTPFTLGQHAVNAFFFLSGLMLSQSIERRPDISDYLWARFLRIFPALLAFGIAMTFIAGPLLSSAPVAAYFADKHTWTYPLAVTLTFGKSAAPLMLFDNLPYAGQVNPPLWTIKYEILAYLMLAALSLSGLRKYTLVLWLVPAASLALFMHQASLGEAGVASPLYQFGRYGFCFGLGMIVYHYRDRIPTAPWWLAVSVLLVPATHGTVLEHAAYVVAVAHAAMLIGVRRYGWLTNVTQRNDISYGVYIYHWPVQQALLVMVPGIGFVTLLGVDLVLTALLAMVSWRLVEEPAMRLKKLSPRKMFRKVFGQTVPRERSIAGL